MISVYFIYYSIILFFINLIIFTTSFPIVIQARHNIHVNFWICFVQLYICYFGENLSILIIWLSFLPIKEFDDEDIRHLFIIGTSSSISFENQIFCTFCLLAIERLVATIKKHNYENSQNVTLIVTISSIVWIYSVMIGISWHILNFNKIGILTIFSWCFTGINFMLLAILSIINQKLSKIRSDSIIKLSERYQIYENRRGIQMALPQILIGSLGLIISNVFFVLFTEYFDSSSITYFTLLFHNFFSTTAMFYHLLVSRKLSKTILKFFRTKFKPNHNKTSKENSDENVRRNPMGKPIVIKEIGANLHFKQLKEAWS